MNVLNTTELYACKWLREKYVYFLKINDFFLKSERNAKSNQAEIALITDQMTKLKASVNTQCTQRCGEMGTTSAETLLTVDTKMANTQTL